jgi:hypothetical protein
MIWITALVVLLAIVNIVLIVRLRILEIQINYIDEFLYDKFDGDGSEVARFTLDDFIEKLKEVIKGFISFEVVVVDINSNVSVKSIDNMLLDTYNMFSKTNDTMLRYEIQKIDTDIVEYETLAKIRPIIASGISSKLPPEQIIDLIEKQTGVDKNVSKELMSKYRISKLLTLDVDTSNLNNSKQELLKNLNDLNGYVLDQYTKL